MPTAEEVAESRAVFSGRSPRGALGFADSAGSTNVSINGMVRNGLLSQGRAKKLRITVSEMKSEMAMAVLEGESAEDWFVRTTSEMKLGYDVVDGMSEKFPPGMELIGVGEWLRVKGGMTLDSGCSVFVMLSRWLRHLVLEPSDGSKRGQKFIAASNHSVKNEGQRTVRFRTADGSRRQMVFQVAAVNKILASIAGICDNGNSVLFRSDSGKITNPKDGRETKFRRHGNVYVMDMRVRNPRAKPDIVKPKDFARHGRGKQFHR